MQASARAPSFREALRVWARIGLLSFGGPAGQIALMHRVLVEEKRWIGEERFLHALQYCMLLPGPEAQQLAIYVGWLLHRTPGGLAAGILFVLPGALTVLALSVLYAAYRDVGVVASLFYGMKAAVLVIVLEALLRIGRRALRARLHPWIAAFAFAAIFLFQVPFPAIVLGAGVAGFLLERLVPGVLVSVAPAREVGAAAVVDALLERGDAGHVRPTVARTFRTVAIAGAAWLVPLAAIVLALGRGNVFAEIAVLFSKAAVVTFGGAYAVLAYLAQQAVETYAWLAPPEMLDGLGLAETTPGPLILVTQFVGFLAAFRNPGAFDPLLAGLLGAALTTWMTFAPCFLWIFAGAPWIESLRGRRGLDAALSAITAAVVGVIANLAVWFALHGLFARVHERPLGPMTVLVPEPGSLDPVAACLSLGAGLALLRWHVGLLPTLAGSALAGVVVGAIRG